MWASAYIVGPWKKKDFSFSRKITLVMHSNAPHVAGSTCDLYESACPFADSSDADHQGGSKTKLGFWGARGHKIFIFKHLFHGNPTNNYNNN